MFRSYSYEYFEELTEKYENFEFHNSSLNFLFKSIFKVPNGDIAISIMNAFLAHEEPIDKISFINPMLISSPFEINKKMVAVDLYYRNGSDKRSYLIELQIHNKFDVVFYTKFVIYRAYNKIIGENEKFVIDEKVRSVKFLYYDVYDNDLFYHRLIKKNDEITKNINGIIINDNENTKNFNKKNDSKQDTNGLELLKNKNINENEVIIIELKKFRRKLDKEALKKLEVYSEEIENDNKEIKEKEDKENKTEEEINEIENIKKDVQKRERILKLHLWLAFLSKMDTVNIEDLNYLLDDKYFDEIEKKNNFISCIEIRNEINLGLFKLFRKYDELEKALEIFEVPITYVSQAGEFELNNIELIKELKMFKKNATYKLELEAIDKKLEARNKVLEKIDKVSEAQNKVSEAQNKVSEAQNKVSEAQNKVFEAQKKVFEATKKEFEAKIKEYEAKIKEYEAKIKEYETTKKEYEVTKKEFEAKFKEYEAEKKGLKRLRLF